MPDASPSQRLPIEPLRPFAREQALEIMEHYVPEPLDDDKAAALKSLVDAADSELK